jgi:hypothetical protein
MFASPLAFNLSPLADNVGPTIFIVANNVGRECDCLQARGCYVCKPLQITSAVKMIHGKGTYNIKILLKNTLKVSSKMQFAI